MFSVLLSCTARDLAPVWLGNWVDMKVDQGGPLSKLRGLCRKRDGVLDQLRGVDGAPTNQSPAILGQRALQGTAARPVATHRGQILVKTRVHADRETARSAWTRSRSDAWASPPKRPATDADHLSTGNAGSLQRTHVSPAKYFPPVPGKAEDYWRGQGTIQTRSPQVPTVARGFRICAPVRCPPPSRRRRRSTISASDRGDSWAVSR